MPKAAAARDHYRQWNARAQPPQTPLRGSYRCQLTGRARKSEKAPLSFRSAKLFEIWASLNRGLEIRKIWGSSENTLRGVPENRTGNGFLGGQEIRFRENGFSKQDSGSARGKRFSKRVFGRAGIRSEKRVFGLSRIREGKSIFRIGISG